MPDNSNPDSMPPTRPKSVRLWVVSALLIILVCLPIMPFKVWLPTAKPDLNHLAEVGRTWWQQNFGPRETARTILKAPLRTKPVDDAIVMEATASQLSVQASKNPNDPYLENQLGVIYLRMGNLDQAEWHLLKAKELSGKALDKDYRESHRYRSEGRAIEATQMLLDSSKLSVQLAAAQCHLAKVYQEQGHTGKALAQLKEASLGAPVEEAKAVCPGGHRISPREANLLAQGEALMNSHQFEPAMADFRQVVTLDPNLALAHHQLGLAGAFEDDPLLAVDELEKALRLDPGNALIHHNLGLAYQAAGRPEEAVDELKKAIALNPKLTGAYLSLGGIYSQAGRLAEAQKVFEDAVHHQPQSAAAHNNLATMLALSGNTDSAIREFHQALALSPQMASAHYGLGLALFNSKHYLGAISEFKQALALNPHLIDAQDKLEHAYRLVSNQSALSTGLSGESLASSGIH